MKKVGVFVFLILLLASFSSASIIISQPKSQYSFGDELTFSLTVSSDNDIVDFLRVSLLCSSSNSSDIELAKTPFSVRAKVSKTFDFSTIIDPSIVGDMRGDCFLKTSFDSQESYSQHFILSNKLNVIFSIDNSVFNPGDNFTIKGSASKDNLGLLDGYFNISSESFNLYSSGIVQSGNFERKFEISKDSPPGNHEVKLEAYDLNSRGAVMNAGSYKQTITIRQVPVSLSLGIDSSNYVPGNEFNYKVMVLDQIGQEMNSQVKLIFLDPSGNEIINKIIPSGVQFKEIFEPSSVYGAWTLKIESFGLSESRVLNFEKLEKLDYQLMNKSLLVKNSGNVPISKDINVHIGNQSESVLVELDVAESKEYKLMAPNGNYNIKIDDGIISSSIGTSFLTGNSVSVRDGYDILYLEFFHLNIFIWALLVLVLLSFSIGLYRKVRKNPSVLNQENIKLKKMKFSEPIPQENIVSSGMKQNASILSLHLKNLGEIHASSSSSEAISAIDSALLSIKDSGAKIYADGNTRVMIFVPLLTKKDDNTVDSVRAAKSLRGAIEDYNRNHSLKINYGLGVHNGDLVVEKVQGIFKFTSIGGAVRTSKYLANLAEGQILLSEKMHELLAGKARMDQFSAKIWKLTEITSRDRYQQFVSKFEEKQRERLRNQ